MRWLQLRCNPARIAISPAASTSEGRLVRGPAAPKLPTASAACGTCRDCCYADRGGLAGFLPCFLRASERLRSDLPKVSPLPLPGWHREERWHTMQSCIDSQGHKRSELGEALVIPRPACAPQIIQAEHVCGLWGLADPTSSSYVTFENYLRRQYESTAFLKCEMEIKVPTLNRKLVLLFKILYFHS